MSDDVRGDILEESCTGTRFGNEPNPLTKQLHRFTIRGISNTSGTACHISCGCIILCHCLDSVISVVNLWLKRQQGQFSTPLSKGDYRFMHDVQVFLCKLKDSSESDNTPANYVYPLDFFISDPIDPSKFFQQMKEHLGLESNTLGDGVAGLVKILHSINEALDRYDKENKSSNNVTFMSVIDSLLYCGKIQSFMYGKKYETSTNSDGTRNLIIVTRTKKMKVRKLANPWLIHLDGSHGMVTLESILHQFLRKEQPVQGFQWNNEFDEEIRQETITDGFSSSMVLENELKTTEWKTSKISHIIEFPPLLMVNLQRFQMDTIMNRLIPIDVNLTINDTIHLNQYTNEGNIISSTMESAYVSNDVYKLTGGIVHVDDNCLDPCELLDEEGGHYVTLIRKPGASSPNWFFIDDDKVEVVGRDTALELLGGTIICQQTTSILTEKIDNTCEIKSNTEGLQSGTYRGVFLVYERTDLQSLTQDLLHKLQQQLTNTSSELLTGTNPEVLIGRRLRVKWAKSKWYSGVITSYNVTTAKHSVQYDDGEIKHYRLGSKTFVWED